MKKYFLNPKRDFIPAKKGQKIHFINFGCQMNISDTEIGKGFLLAGDFILTDASEEADIILVNTCCVREHAAIRAYGNINSLGHLKKKNKNLIIGVGGCLARRDREIFFEKSPVTDFLFSPEDMDKLPEILLGLEKPDLSFRESIPRSSGAIRRDRHRAWITIIKGCENFCAYCIVPFVRGPEISLSLERILEDVNTLVQDGVKEIILLGQNVNSWGKNLVPKNDFPSLLQALTETDIQRIRFITSHPKDFSPRLSQVIASSEKIGTDINLPVQSGSDKILSLMNRGYTRDEYLCLVHEIRKTVTKAAIMTDLIVGFPGETESDFQDTLSLMREIQFAEARCFYYSPQKGTFAWDLPGLLPLPQRKERLKRMIEEQKTISAFLNQKAVGSVFDILVDGQSGRDPNKLIGQSLDGKRVVFKGDKTLIGEFIRVEITKATANTLQGKII